MKKIRFDLELSDKDLEALEGLSNKCNRSRKNMCESLTILAINTFKSGNILVDLNKLGILNEATEERSEI